MFPDSVLEETLPGECAGHVPMYTLQGPLIELHRGGELGYLLFKSYNLSLQSVGTVSARITGVN